MAGECGFLILLVPRRLTETTGTSRLIRKRKEGKIRLNFVYFEQSGQTNTLNYKAIEIIHTPIKLEVPAMHSVKVDTGWINY